MSQGPKDHTNIIGSKRNKGDTRNHILQDPCVYVLFRGPNVKSRMQTSPHQKQEPKYGLSLSGLKDLGLQVTVYRAFVSRTWLCVHIHKYIHICIHYICVPISYVYIYIHILTCLCCLHVCIGLKPFFWGFA